MTTIASIFCDGACRGNGTAHAIAGWAWAYWPGVAYGEPTRFCGERLAGTPATNQRAELTALLECLRWWHGAGGGLVAIHTDSMYAINCTTKWGPAWRRKGWKRDSGEPLQNLDLIKPLVELWGAEAGRRGWRLVHVRGHQTGSGPEVHGNNWVDRAAVAASLGTGAAIVDPPSPVSPSPSPPAPSVRKPPVRGMFVQSDLRLWFGGKSE